MEELDIQDKNKYRNKQQQAMGIQLGTNIKKDLLQELSIQLLAIKLKLHQTQGLKLQFKNIFKKNK